jgi:lipopolysaccharide export system protein LptA
MRPLLLLLIFCFALAGAGGARAEKADRDKPVNIEADRMFYDDLRQVNIFEGNVTLTQGTLMIRADKLVVKQDPEGFQHGTAVNGPGGFAYIRQKRDGVDEYIEGWGETIEYDGKTEKADLIKRARVLRGTDEVRGDLISYDGRTEFYSVLSGKEGCVSANPVTCKVHAVFLPKSGAGADAGAKDGTPGTPGNGGTPGSASKGSTPVAAPKGPDLNLKTSGGIAAPREEYPEPPKP